MNAMINDMFENMPWKEMLKVMIPVYQKHFTHNDLNAMIAFYSSPVGQKLVRELPAITAESMRPKNQATSKTAPAVSLGDKNLSIE